MRRTAREVRALAFAVTPTHRHLRERLTVIFVATILVDALCAVLGFVLERGARGSEIHDLGSALFWASTQLLSVSSSLQNPVTAGGRILDVFMEAYAITVIAALAGSVGTFLHRRSREREHEYSGSRP